MASRKARLVAEICFYGNGAPDVGYGWLGRLTDGTLLGDGEPKPGLSQTHCLFMACEEIRRLWPAGGMVRVFAPGGRLMADTDLDRPGYYGDLKWSAAPVYEISAADIMAAAEKTGNA